MFHLIALSFSQENSENAFRLNVEFEENSSLFPKSNMESISLKKPSTSVKQFF